MAAKEDNGIELYDLALNFLLQMEFKVEEKIVLIGTSGKKYQFDMMIKSNSGQETTDIVVNIVDWKRAVGVDRLIRFDRMLLDIQNKKGMIISNRFSEPAIKYAQKHGVILYEKKHLQKFPLEKIRK